MTGSRVLVHQSIADRAKTELTSRIKAVRPGPPPMSPARWDL
ncbi:hypothetical protein [Granulicella sibirica]